MKIKSLNFIESKRLPNLIVAIGANSTYWIKNKPDNGEYEYGELKNYPYGRASTIEEAKQNLQKIHEQNLIENFLE